MHWLPKPVGRSREGKFQTCRNFFARPCISSSTIAVVVIANKQRFKRGMYVHRALFASALGFPVFTVAGYAGKYVGPRDYGVIISQNDAEALASQSSCFRKREQMHIGVFFLGFSTFHP